MAAVGRYDERSVETEIQEDSDTEAVKKMLVWGIESADTNNNVKIYAMNDECITVRRRNVVLYMSSA